MGTVGNVDGRSVDNHSDTFVVEQQENIPRRPKSGKAVLKCQRFSVINLKKASTVLFNREDTEWLPREQCFQNGFEAIGGHVDFPYADMLVIDGESTTFLTCSDGI